MHVQCKRCLSSMFNTRPDGLGCDFCNGRRPVLGGQPHWKPTHITSVHFEDEKSNIVQMKRKEKQPVRSGNDRTDKGTIGQP